MKVPFQFFLSYVHVPDLFGANSVLLTLVLYKDYKRVQIQILRNLRSNHLRFCILSFFFWTAYYLYYLNYVTDKVVDVTHILRVYGVLFTVAPSLWSEKCPIYRTIWIFCQCILIPFHLKKESLHKSMIGYTTQSNIVFNRLANSSTLLIQYHL